MLVRESQKKKNEGVGSIPLPSFKTIGIIALIIIIWLTWDSGNTESTSVPFYTTWWFWTLVVLFILSTTFLIWNFVSKKKKQEKLAQEKKKQSNNHDDDHTDPEVEKHAHDDHAHHGDSKSTKLSVWFVRLLIVAGIMIGGYIIIKYGFLNSEKHTINVSSEINTSFVVKADQCADYYPTSGGEWTIVYPSGAMFTKRNGQALIPISGNPNPQETLHGTFTVIPNGFSGTIEVGDK